MDNSIFANTFLANMMQDYFINNPFFYSLALTLVHFVWQGFVVAFALKTALVLISNKKPQLRYLLSSLAMLVSLALPFITFFIIRQPFTIPTIKAVNIVPLFNFSETSLQNAQGYWTTNWIEFLPYISLAWLITVFFLASKLFIEVIMVNQLPKQSVKPASAVLNTRFLQLVEQMHLKITPRLLISLKTQVPMAIGWLKPVILIPASMLSGLTNTQLEMLILHELAHIRRHDYLVNFLQTLVSILLFFHPGVQWISKQMRNEREYCSDDIAVKHCGNALAYAHTLADTAALCSKHRHHTIPNMAMAASGGDLKQRVVRLVNHHCTPENETGKWLAAAFIIMLVLGIASKQFLAPSFFEFGSSPLTFQKTIKSNNPLLANNPTINTSLANYLLINDAPTLLPNNNSSALMATIPLSNDNEHLYENEKMPMLTATPKVLAQSQDKKLVQTLTFKSNKILSSNTPNNEPLNNEQLSNKLKISTNDNLLDSDSLNNEVISKKLTATMLVSTFVDMKTKAQTQNKHANLTVNKPTEKTIKIANIDVSLLHKNSISDKQPAVVSTGTNDKQKPVTLTSMVAQQNIDQSVNDFYTAQNNQATPRTFKEHNNQSTTLSTLSQTAAHSLLHRTLQTRLPITLPAELKAQLIKAVDPKYPATAKRKGIEIEVKVNFTIDVSGRIKNLAFEHQNKVGYFRSSIKSAMQKWAFEPAKKGGKAVESQMSKIFSFSLQG